MSVQVSLQWYHRIWYLVFENVVGVSKSLGIEPPVFSKIVDHLPFIPEWMLTQHRWLRLHSLAVAKLPLTLWLL